MSPLCNALDLDERDIIKDKGEYGVEVGKAFFEELEVEPKNGER